MLRNDKTTNIYASSVKPEEKIVAIGGMTKEEIDAELQKGMDDIKEGRVISIDEVEEEMRRLYGI